VVRHFAPHDTRERLLVALVFAAFAEIVWTIFLGWRLPLRYEAHHWDLAWVGLDVGEIAMILATAWAAWRRRALFIIFASVLAVLLLLDAWFDVTTANPNNLAESVFLAAVFEVPIALLLLYFARRAARLFLRAHFDGHRLASVPISKVPMTPLDGEH
jgi:hypothetical protein